MIQKLVRGLLNFFTDPPEQGTVTADEILSEWRAYVNAPKDYSRFAHTRYDHASPGEPSVEEIEYNALKNLARKNQAGLYDLIFSGKATEKELSALIFLGGEVPWLGLTERLYDKAWGPFIALIRERQNELPASIQTKLSEHLTTYGY